MSDVQRLIEKLGLAIHGEDRATVIKVLAAFTMTMLDDSGLTIDDYVQELAKAATREVVKRSDMD